MHRRLYATLPLTSHAGLLVSCSLSQNLTGLGVTNSDGALVDIISVRDLRGIGVKAEHFQRLWHSVKRYKEAVRAEFKRQTPPTPIRVTADDTLQSVIKKMDDGNIHRVFVVERGVKKDSTSGEAGELWRPTHVITQRDVMRFLLFKMGLQPVSVMASAHAMHQHHVTRQPASTDPRCCFRVVCACVQLGN